MACSTAPYHVELDTIIEATARTQAIWRGDSLTLSTPGIDFSADSDTEQKEQHIRDTKAYIQEHVPIPDSGEMRSKRLCLISQ